MEYKKRIIDKILKEKMQLMGGVLIEGPKGAGKTSAALQVCKSKIDLSENNIYEMINSFGFNIEKIILNDRPLLIDEWQFYPEIFNLIKRKIDDEQKQGQYILTGSSTSLNINEKIHSGTGRFSHIVLRPMSLFESGDSTGKVSIKSLFEIGKIEPFKCNYDLEKIAKLACRGGFPAAVNINNIDLGIKIAAEFYLSIVNRDINKIDNVIKDKNKIVDLMRSYARFQGSQCSENVILEDINKNGNINISHNTVSYYLALLRKLYIIEDLPSWNPNLRSKTAIRTSNNRYFIDPSIATESLKTGPNELLKHPETFGFIFETLAIRDLRVYASAIEGDVYHYRDKNNLECDAIIHLRDGRYALIEIKLGGKKAIEEGCKNLLKLKTKIDTEKMGKPSFMLLLCATSDYAYTNKDNITICPISHLKD